MDELTRDKKFIVVEHSFKERVGKESIYRVVLKNSSGDTFSKNSEDKILFTAYPLNESFEIEFSTKQTKLEEL